MSNRNAKIIIYQNEEFYPFAVYPKAPVLVTFGYKFNPVFILKTTYQNIKKDFAFIAAFYLEHFGEYLDNLYLCSQYRIEFL